MPHPLLRLSDSSDCPRIHESTWRVYTKGEAVAIKLLLLSQAAATMYQIAGHDAAKPPRRDKANFEISTRGSAEWRHSSHVGFKPAPLPQLYAELVESYRSNFVGFTGWSAGLLRLRGGAFACRRYGISVGTVCSKTPMRALRADSGRSLPRGGRYANPRRAPRASGTDTNPPFDFRLRHDGRISPSG
jgi:hypothetical protein